MSQYKEEQLGEIFSLESIYPDELESKCFIETLSVYKFLIITDFIHFSIGDRAISSI